MAAIRCLDELVQIGINQDPDNAPSDGPNMVPLQAFEPLMRELMAIDSVVKTRTAAAT